MYLAPKTLVILTRKKILSISEELRNQSYQQQISIHARKIEQEMSNTLRDYPYYHAILDMACGGQASQCSIFDDEGYIISHDGGHLTQRGAQLLTQRLKPLLSSLAQ